MANPISYWAVFNNWQFNNVPGLQIYAIDQFKPGTRTLDIFTIARRSQRKTSSAYYQANSINISCYINAGTRVALEKALDILYTNIQALEGSLVLSQSGTQRQYIVTYSAFKINNPNTGNSQFPTSQGGFLDFTLSFELSDNFGYDTTYTQIANLTNQNSSPIAISYTQGGGADQQVPFIQIQYTALTGATSGTVLVGNNATGQQISITRSWAVNDLIQIDSRTPAVQVNGVDTNFTGAWPTFPPGPGIIGVADNFSTRTFKLFAYVYNRWN